MKFIENTEKISGLKTFLSVIILSLTGMLALLSFNPVISAEAADKVPESFTNLAETVSPSVVNIRTVTIVRSRGREFRHFQNGPFGNNEDPFNDFFERFFGGGNQREFKQRSLGSGFIIDKDGYIVTNNHVVENADEIRVMLQDKKEFDAKIIGRDPKTDLALIKIKSGHNLPAVKLGDSDKLNVGQWVVAIGNPFGLGNTVTAGIVSAKGRVIGSGPYDNFIQTDASINPGNSGGPLINMKGEVVGINTAIIAGGHGIGFAIPANMAQGVISQLKEHGEVTRGWLGVAIQELKGDIAGYYGLEDEKGVLVTEVFPGDPADLAGIRPEDIILEVNGKKVETSRMLTKLIADTKIGNIVKIKVLRKGKKKIFNVEIAKREDTEANYARNKKRNGDEIGIRVAELTPEIARRFNIQERDGIIVVGVEPGDKGEDSGILVGDIIKEVNRKVIKTVGDYKKVLKSIKKGGSVEILIKRINSGFLVLKLEK